MQWLDPPRRHDRQDSAGQSKVCDDHMFVAAAHMVSLRKFGRRAPDFLNVSLHINVRGKRAGHTCCQEQQAHE